ncbi:phytoene desaturase family protein [Sphingomonas bisphenolicum]|uniref:Pyridine nucleotide-disulfide oxidoreductase domain-containing protein 2 n=1 Tax=Sphingomonas bisphenolicum TaxID=296544 RepID=A0ABM7G848_9SPHN|nr:NAD(P)/FAD-dependent oxidoreductase [Sphingomonas bisphenolicum]BBF71818.1 FAD-dependent oxidoreductase [Sphingomonas bisphenolicum]
MSIHDIVVMGGGHNGLTAAAYMAKAGKKVLVLERKPHFGGGVSTRELIAPGYWHDEHSNVHIMIQGNPMIREDELGLLSKFGLEYIYPELPHVSIWDDGTVMRTWKDLDRTCQEIAQYSPRDAEAYRRFVGISQSVLPMFMSGLYAPPFPMGAFVAMMDQSDEGRFLLDVMQRSALDVANQYFESDRLKIHIVRLITENLQMPDELGTGMGVLLMPGIIHTYGVSMPRGGSGELSKALVRAIEHMGGEVRCNAEVKRVIVSSGKAVGLEMTDGEPIMAKDGVIGAIHPHVLRRFVSETPEPVLQRAERVTPSTFSINLLHMALKEKAKLRWAEGEGGVMTELLQTHRMRDMLLDYDHLRRGVVPPRRLIAGGDNTTNDPSRAPAGGGVFYGVTFAPYDLHEGGPTAWDRMKEEIAQESLAQYRLFYSNLDEDNIIGTLVRSPLDHERDSPASFVKGDIHGCAPFMYQTVGHRPTPDLGHFRVPGIESLYLVGPFMHPGGGVFGAGRATAIQMMDDMGIDYDKVCAGAVQ